MSGPNEKNKNTQKKPHKVKSELRQSTFVLTVIGMKSLQRGNKKLVVMFLFFTSMIL